MVRPARTKHNKGPISRGKRGKTVTAPSNNNDEDFEFREEDARAQGGVLGGIHFPTRLSKDINSIKSPKPHSAPKKKRSGSRKRPNSEPGPLEQALVLQGQQIAPRSHKQKLGHGQLNSVPTFRGMVPRKRDASRNSSLHSLDGNADEAHRSSHLTDARHSSSLSAHPHDRPRPSTSTGRGKSASHNFFSQATIGFRERSHAKEEHKVFDLCDEDGHDPGNDTTHTEQSEDEMTAQKATSSVTKKKRRVNPSPDSSKESSSLANSSRVSSLATSLSRSTPTESSAATTNTTDSSKGYNQDSSDEEGLEFVHSHEMSRDSNRRTPNSSSSKGSSNVVYGSSDLFPGSGDESEEDESGVNICQALDGIINEAYGGGTVSSMARQPTPKRARKPAKKTPAERNKSDTPLSYFSRSNNSVSSSMTNESGFGLRGITKVNGRNGPKRRKKKGNAINTGASIKSYSNHIEEDIQSCDSDSLSWGTTQNRRRNASSYGVQKNPYASAPSSRIQLSRKAKTNSTTRVFEDLVDTDEEDDNGVLATVDRLPKKPVRKKKDAIRIAIGKKVFTTQCAIRYERTRKGGAIVLSAVGGEVEHRINLDDESIQETKYFVSKDDDEQAGGATISIDFDESEQMTFLALKVKPNGKNGLLKYSNAYQPEKSDGADGKRYIAIEFRSDKQFLDLLRDLKEDDSLGGFVCDSTSQLNAIDAESYGKSLFQAARKERAERESNVGSPRVRRKRKKRRGSKNSNEILLVFPFGADNDKIDKAAEVLTEASSTVAVKCSENTAVVRSTTLKSTDEDAITSSSERADNDDEKSGDDKDESAGKTKSRAHFLTIRDEDYDRLEPGEFLNDTLIDFWFQWIWRKDPHVDGDVHFFTSHFYTALAKGGPEAVTSWTAKKNIDIFMKKYIFIPVNLSLHWSLCVVVNPGAILNEVGPTCEETMDDELFPCLLFFDSLKAHKKIAITQNVRKWLNSEWQRLEKPKTENAEDAVNPFNKNTMDVFTPRVPYQDNSWDCGVFVCRYGYGVFRLREHSVTYRDRIDKFRSLITNNEEFCFDRNDIVRIRRELATLLDNLSALYKEWKKTDDQAEAEAEEDSKKPAARKLLLEDDKVSGTEVSDSTTTKPVTEQAEGPSASSADDVMPAVSKEADASKPSDPSAQLAEAEVKNAPTNESKDVEMSDGDQASLSTQPENGNAEGIVDMDVDDEASEERTAMDIETVDLAADNVMSVDENVYMQDEMATATFTSAPVKREEDQYGDGAVSAPPQVMHDEDIGEIQREEQPGDKAVSGIFQVTYI